MRLLLALLIVAAPAVAAEEAAETPIEVPTPVPKGFLVAWKPSILSFRVDSGAGAEFGSDKLQPLRALVRYTGTVFDERLMYRAELEGGRFESDTQGLNVGSDGYDAVVRLLGGTATKITPALTLTASGGLITRYQTGRVSGGAPKIGVFGVTSNIEAAYRITPILSFAAFIEGGLAPFPYLSQNNLGDLSDVSEFKGRLQLSMELTSTVALDVGYDFTRWHASFTRSPALGTPDRALLIEMREHAVTIGLRFKP